MYDELIRKIKSAQGIVLSTHRNCDGDGLGGQLALLHGLKKLGKEVIALNVDRPPKKYDYLHTQQWIQTFDPKTTDLSSIDLALIFDTNDGRLVEPLFSALIAQNTEILFIDHHPLLTLGPIPSAGSLIDISSASTGQLCFHLLKKLEIELDETIARCLYTSLVFDTHLFRFVRSAPDSHLIAAELLRYEKNPEEVHRKLFASYSVSKLNFLAHALSQVEYFCDNKVAFIALRSSSIRGSNYGPDDLDDSGDVIDAIMNVECVEIAALLREDAPNSFKLSLRSKGSFSVQHLAEDYGGGGHEHASGAYINEAFDSLRDQLLKKLKKLIAP